MKRTVISILMLGLMGVGTMVAEDGHCDRYRDGRDIYRDNARIAHERNEMNRDFWYGDYRGAEHERQELRRAYRDRNRDYRDRREDWRYRDRDWDWR